MEGTIMLKKGENSVPALTVAYYFLKRAKDAGDPITNKKLQKLLYYAQVWSLVLLDKRLFKERIEAWVHGPAIPGVYRRFRSFEFSPIMAALPADVEDAFSPEELGVLQDIWKVYGKYGADYLEALTHSEAPWQEARRGMEAGERSSAPIDLKLAKEFYAGKRAAAQQRAA